MGGGEARGRASVAFITRGTVNNVQGRPPNPLSAALLQVSLFECDRQNLVLACTKPPLPRPQTPAREDNNSTATANNDVSVLDVAVVKLTMDSFAAASAAIQFAQFALLTSRIASRIYALHVTIKADKLSLNSTLDSIFDLLSSTNDIIRELDTQRDVPEHEAGALVQLLSTYQECLEGARHAQEVSKDIAPDISRRLDGMIDEFKQQHRKIASWLVVKLGREAPRRFLTIFVSQAPMFDPRFRDDAHTPEF